MAMSRLAGIAAKGVAGAVLVYTAANAEVPARVVEKLDKFKEDYALQPHKLPRWTPGEREAVMNQLHRETIDKQHTGSLEENVWSKPLIRFRRYEEDEVEVDERGRIVWETVGGGKVVEDAPPGEEGDNALGVSEGRDGEKVVGKREGGEKA